jgi:hypothetical protein
VGGPNTEARYDDPIRGRYTVQTVTHLRYLGVYIDRSLKWDRHVSIMTNRAHSTIRGINLLGNSVCGLDFLNWCKVYNALVIPTLTYGAQVWYTGIGQKGLLQKMQVTQNKGLRKITGVFRTTLVEPLQNLTGVPPIRYLMTKLMDSYTHRLWAMAPQAMVRRVLTKDWCRYWPDYIIPTMNLTHASREVTTSTYRPLGPHRFRLWSRPGLTYDTPNSEVALERLKKSYKLRDAPYVHVIVVPYTHESRPIGLYYIYHTDTLIWKGHTTGADQTQAICQAVKAATEIATNLRYPHIILWLRPQIPEKILMLKPHRDTHITYNTRALIMIHLDSSPTNTLSLRTCERNWPRSHTKAELKRNQEDIMWTLAQEGNMLTLKERMWTQIHADYTPSPHPSHSACTLPDSNKPAPAIRVAIKARHRLVFATIPHLATGHCFDTTYSERFRAGADDYTTCPCKHIPRASWVRGPRRARHTKEHVIFHCP